MTLTGIKSGLFGYNKKNVCEYVSDLNAVHDSEIKAIEEKLMQQIAELTEKNNALESAKIEIESKYEELSETVAQLETDIEVFKTEKAELLNSNAELENEVTALRSKSDLISAAIINAEKCAGTLIEEATNRANTMVSDAEDKVSAEVKRLENAKNYISEIKSNILLAMKNIESTLGNIESDIETKKTNIEDGETKRSSVKEKFEVFEKNLFRRA